MEEESYQWGMNTPEKVMDVLACSFLLLNSTKGCPVINTYNTMSTFQKSLIPYGFDLVTFGWLNEINYEMTCLH